jgi:hypothetical protein
MNRTLVAAALVGLFGAAAPEAFAQTPATPTFSRDVAPILYKNCTNCHRPGEIGPMPLITYKDARPWAKSIATRVSNGTMPPWHADPGHGQFLNDRSLNASDRETILKWANSGAPEGNVSDLPKLPAFVDGWQMGQPDAVFSMQEDYPVPASGTIDYKYFEVPTNLTEDKWVQAVEVRPGVRAVVHHVIVYMRGEQSEPRQPAQAAAGAARPTPPFSFGQGMRRPADAPKPERAPVENDRAPKRDPGGWLTGYAPGQSVRVYQPGTALKIPKGAVLTVAMHYTANGKETTDRTRIGVKFASEPPKTEVMVVPLQTANFVLKAGSSDTRVDAEMTMNQDVTLWSALPHTHMRGKRWEVTAVYPDGRSELILDVPHYDFNWQLTYRYAEPVSIPRGSSLVYTAWYDNSEKNPANPDPKKLVKWGPQTFDEMHLGYLEYVIDR